MRPVVLVAAGGLAREVLSSLRATGDREPMGFLDDNVSLHGQSIDGLPVLGPPEWAGTLAADVILCAGRGAARRALAERLARAGMGARHYATHVAAGVSVGSGCQIGAGSVLLAGSVLTADVSLGHHVVLMPQVVLTHDDVVGDFATFAAGVCLGGGVRVGRGAYLGMRSSVREGLRVGDDAVLGMGAVAVRSLPAGAVWAGVPARPLVAAARERVAAGGTR